MRRKVLGYLILAGMAVSYLGLTAGTPTTQTAGKRGGFVQYRLAGTIAAGEPDTAWVDLTALAFYYSVTGTQWQTSIFAANNAVAGDSVTVAVQNGPFATVAALFATSGTIADLAGQSIASSNVDIVRSVPYLRLIITDTDVTSNTPSYDLYFWGPWGGN